MQIQLSSSSSSMSSTIDPTVLEVLDKKIEKDKKVEQQERAITYITDLQKIIDANWNTHYLTADATLAVKSVSKLYRLGAMLGLSKSTSPDANPEAASIHIKKKIKFIGKHDSTLSTEEKHFFFTEVANRFNQLLSPTNKPRISEPSEGRDSETNDPKIYSEPSEGRDLETNDPKIYIGPLRYPSLSIDIPEKEDIQKENIQAELSPKEEEEEDLVEVTISPKIQRRKRLPSPITPPVETKKRKRSVELSEEKEKSKTVEPPAIRRSKRIASKNSNDDVD